METITNYINSLAAYAKGHGVNAYIFLFLYAISIPLYYYPILKFKKAFKKKNTSTAKIGIRYLAFNRLAWALPLIYVLIWGRNLPIALTAVIMSYIILGTTVYLFRIGKITQRRNVR